jgi:hypothetical protein
VARAIRSLAFVVLCLASLELAARLFWRLHGVPFSHPERVLQAYYPGLAKIDLHNPKWAAARAHVLLLGGSTLHPRWGTVQAELREQLAFAGYRDVRLFNLAAAGLTSRDSRLQYEAIGNEHFDLVLVYDGMNEARANNVPPDLFRDDYGHYGWYEIVNALSRHQGRAWFALPYTLEYVGLRLRQLVLASHYVSRNGPRADWLRYGDTVRSAGPFEANLRAILGRATSRGEHVVLMTFATWVPQDYTLERFRSGQLAYGLHETPLELWGDPDDVQRAVAAHNAVIRAVADENRGVGFVDQARLLAGEPRWFNDPCHLSLRGARRFVRNLLPVILPALREVRSPDGHVHDEHHQHRHAPDPAWDPHAHRHRHEAMTHVHAHRSDVHHRHRH